MELVSTKISLARVQAIIKKRSEDKWQGHGMPCPYKSYSEKFFKRY